MNKQRIAVIFGGVSPEHQVSLQSAQNIMRAINPEKYKVIPIGISSQGDWLTFNQIDDIFTDPNDPDKIAINKQAGTPITVSNHGELLCLEGGKNMGKIDIAFPIIHGSNGEDGILQGFLKVLNIPFVGPDVLGSAVSMDKDITKRLLRDAGIPTARSLTFYSGDKTSYDDIVAVLGKPLFVKPANGGSSIGISKVENSAEFAKALRSAFENDEKIIIEECIKGREIECAVLGKRASLKSSTPGEIIVEHKVHSFYSYQAKYLDKSKNATRTEIPAKMPADQLQKIQKMAIETCRALNAYGMSRVDFFVTQDGEIFVNEINTLPGFTNISMYPKLWEYDGISQTELIDKLIHSVVKM